MKPKIKREFSLTWKQLVWFCRGAGSLGFGKTPSDAYWDWKWRINQRGVQ